ncbi:unnamed protein product [Phytophthora fragariaefolia]|uniref:Unnamed protein product n=1 Tax=Phytophthora fragariaefolia TaxID=1490495 RepID=A0A9W6UE14_9STRA|nr:unnamed protein product [Phytophthora fragariaefolia]
MSSRTTRAARRAASPTESVTPRASASNTTAPTRRPSTQQARKKQRAVRTRWPLGDGNNEEDTVLVSSNVAITAAGDDESSEKEEDNNRTHHSNNEGIGPQPPGGLLAGASTSNQESHDGAETQAIDELEDMSWWDALTPGQPRSMIRRFMATPSPAVPATTAAPQRILVPMVEQPMRSKCKKLLISDFHGKADESVEAWLASVLNEAESQARLGEDE